MPTNPLSIYLHIPFCAARCTYCAFNTYTNAEAQIPAYTDALINEIRGLGAARPRTAVHSIFFGGGTPSILSVDQVRAILSALNDSFTLTPNAEISLEANPCSVDTAYLAGLRQAGINRLSLGMQSAVESELKMFARVHQAADVVRAVQAARSAGFDNFNLDLIYGAPHQTLNSWAYSVDAALELDPPHLAMYALELEKDTSMTRAVENGWLPRPDDDLAADMYELADSKVRAAGLGQYEISNWAKPGRECLHNLQYWRHLPYLGIGAGAHGHAENEHGESVRYQVVRPIPAYILAAMHPDPVTAYPLTHSAEAHEVISTSTAMFEELMTGLRLLNEGVSAVTFQDRFGVSLESIYGDQIARFVDTGLLYRRAERLFMTDRARLLSNIIFRELVAPVVAE